METYKQYLISLVEGGTILFVGTQKQAQDAIKTQAGAFVECSA